VAGKADRKRQESRRQAQVCYIVLLHELCVLVIGSLVTPLAVVKRVHSLALEAHITRGNSTPPHIYIPSTHVLPENQ